MRRPRFSAACSRSRSLLLPGLVLALACRDRPDNGAGSPSPFPPSAELESDFDQPIRLTYVCGNRFLVTNAHSVPVSLRYRVRGTEEEGQVDLARAPDQDPAFSEAMIETRGRGVLELFQEGRPLRARANAGVPCTPDTRAPALLTTGGPEAGEWSAPFNWPIVAVHLSLLPNGKVLSWGHAGLPQLWNPASGQFTTVPSQVLLFCAGQALLADGKLLAAGGHIDDDHGLPDISLFNYKKATWSRSAPPMQRGRWYPTTTIGPAGEVLIIAGRDEAGVTVNVPEVWKNGTIRSLANASRPLAYYPRIFLAPNGRMFYAGEEQTTRYLSLSGSGSWSTVGNRLYPNREYGSAVMYEQGRILYAGGGFTTNSAETIDLTKAGPAWQWTGSMAYPRRHLNLTVLPTGDVLATGGTGGTVHNDLSLAVHAAELWSPTTGQWTTLASNVVSRGYHATSILLPDGRVLHSGSGDGAGAPSERNAELFSPPYLFLGPRPAITAAPAEMRYNATFHLDTPDAASITKVSLIRLGAATHAFDMNQRYQTMSFTPDSTGLTLKAPGSRARTPPGHYMLFILTGEGVPSVAKIIRLR